MKIPSQLTGIAGEYFVAAELSRRGYIASISLRNTSGIDILATNETATRSVTIQCKTQKNRGPWLLNEKCERITSKNHFYVFVTLGTDTERPRYHIVPSRAVAKYASTNHQSWLKTPGRTGQTHKDNPIRQFRDSADRYLDRWELLGL